MTVEVRAAQDAVGLSGKNDAVSWFVLQTLQHQQLIQELEAFMECTRIRVCTLNGAELFEYTRALSSA
ncbi:hypothetical protein RvY_18050 [Ramazzottius varieornatus]|uniref:Uncharacterized protein n=1 Tax=Ramazzottius varieornatus TaxID=947166 RepID=A0A1D1W4C4_RAMVA|nr:hypothetical protein RvY_18050 [Ramazzottius varieornatus]